MKKRIKPLFRRSEGHRYKKLGFKWRKSGGLQNKLRRYFKGKGNIPSIGYGAQKEVRGLHPSGYREVIVFNPLELNDVTQEIQGIRICSSVGFKKRIIIRERAKELNLKVLN